MKFKQKLHPLLLADTLVLIWQLDKKGASHEEIAREVKLTKYRIDDVLTSLRNYIVLNKISTEKRAQEYMKAKTIIHRVSSDGSIIDGVGFVASNPVPPVLSENEYIDDIDKVYGLLKTKIIDLFEMRVEREVHKRTNAVIQELEIKHGKEAFELNQKHKKEIENLQSKINILEEMKSQWGKTDLKSLLRGNQSIAPSNKSI